MLQSAAYVSPRKLTPRERGKQRAYGDASPDMALPSRLKAATPRFKRRVGGPGGPSRAGTAADWHKLKRLGRYLLYVPEMEWLFYYQDEPSEALTDGDSDWAGERRERKSTSSVVEFHGDHMLDSSVTSQQVRALCRNAHELQAADSK